MEVLKYTDILGVTLDGDVVEGRMVVLTSTGADKPTNAGQAAKARYIVAWPVENRQLPIFQPYPTYDRALRWGFDRTSNSPFTPTAVYTFYPNLSEEPLTIPSGTAALLFSAGEFVVTSGNWVYDSSLVAGDELEVNYTGTNAGKLQKKSSGTAVAVVTAVLDGQKLQFRTYGE